MSASGVAQVSNGVRFTVVVATLTLVGAAVMVFVIAQAGAPSSLVLATALAALPIGPVVGSFLWLDRYEPEPRWLLGAGLVWGAFVATAVALVIQGIGGLGLGVSQESSIVVWAPVSEEATKGFFLLLLLWWRRHELDGILDGIVYAGMVGAGFAFTENILYLAAAYNGTDGMGPGGSEVLTYTFVLRCLASPFAHPLFTAFVGIGVGVAVASRSPWGRLLWPVLGYALAVASHALWNASALKGGEGFLGIYVLIMMPVFVSVLAFAAWARSAERRMLTAALTDAAGRGLLPHTDIPWVVDLGSRRRARAWARASGGAAAERAMRDYQRAAIELGFLHHRYLRGTPPPDFALRGQAFVDRIAEVRPTFTFPGQVVPAR